MSVGTFNESSRERGRGGRDVIRSPPATLKRRVDCLAVVAVAVAVHGDRRMGVLRHRSEKHAHRRPFSARTCLERWRRYGRAIVWGDGRSFGGEMRARGDVKVLEWLHARRCLAGGLPLEKLMTRTRMFERGQNAGDNGRDLDDEADCQIAQRPWCASGRWPAFQGRG